MRPHQILFISLVLGLSVAAGAFAAVRTVHLGVQGAKVDTRQRQQVIAHRQSQLDRFEASLRGALRKRPPKLPRIPHFKPIPKPAVVAAAPAVPVSAGFARTRAAPAPRVVYVQPRHVITIHRHGGEHEHDGNSGQRGGGDD